MEAIFCAIVLGLLAYYLSKNPPKKKIVQIELTSLVNKGTQTDPETPESPMSTLSSIDIDFQFMVDESYMEKINKTKNGKDWHETFTLPPTSDQEEAFPTQSNQYL